MLSICFVIFSKQFFLYFEFALNPFNLILFAFSMLLTSLRIYSIDSFIVYFDDKPLLRIRGWGYLTGSGVGGLNLPSELANNLSTSFAEYIVDRLNGV